MVDTTKEEATNQRILTHMNAQHTSSLQHYLQHYLALPASRSRDPKLTAFELDSLTITNSLNEVHKIPITPPLESYAHARERMVAMDKEAKEGLGIKEQLVGKWTAPTEIGHKVVAGLVTFYLLSYSLKSFVVPGTPQYQLLDKVWSSPVGGGFLGGGAEGYLKLQDRIVVPLIVIHAVETVIMAYRLKGAGLKAFSGLWWKWMGSCLIEGVGSHQRLGKEIRRSLKAKEEEKH